MRALWLGIVATVIPYMASAGRVVLPQNRTAYYCDEPLELAVAGLAAGQTVVVRLLTETGTTQPVEFVVAGTGGTDTVVFAPYTLAPGRYRVELDGQPVGPTITIASGVNRSPLLLSQTVEGSQVKAAGGNFLVGNAFEFGLIGPDGLPMTDPQGKRSRGMQAFERAIELDLPTLVYMYWTGYVTHKPWGSEKSWAEPTMQEMMRLLTLHTAQRLRRYQRNLLSIGTLDEPGLSWGPTPAGGLASGFPNWDERGWYESRGWRYTDDPANRPDEDWLKYMSIRCGIIRESNELARAGLKRFLPGVPFATDLYAAHAIMDGTDPLNQQVNEIPTTHVFLDWGMGRAGVIGAVYVEKAHDPTAKVAHATNGQLMEETVPQPNQRDAYRVTLNGLLACGLRSNWWLNCTGMTPEDLAAINEPALRWGPLFDAMMPAEHDTAILWSWTELCLREKSVCAREAHKQPGERITVMAAGLPRCTAYEGTEQELEVNAYSVGSNYREQVLAAHQALGRAGYPAHILHEKLLPHGVLCGYRTLLVIGQTHGFPPQIMSALRGFVRRGGKIVVDATTTVKLPGAVRTDADFRDPAYRWSVPFSQDEKRFATPREASLYRTNWFMDSMARAAVEPLKLTMRQTAARPAIVSECSDLIAERHVCGHAALYMVLNAHEELPQISPDRRHWIYNYAPLRATFALQGVSAGAVVYAVEGPDWSQARRLESPCSPQTAQFAPGEMKLYYVLPRPPAGLSVSGRWTPDRVLTSTDGTLDLTVRISGAPGWPLRLVVKDPDGAHLYDVFRGAGPNGLCHVRFPLGLNAQPGRYEVRVESLLPGPRAVVTFSVPARAPRPAPIADQVRVLHADQIRRVLEMQPELVVALGSRQSYEAVARELVAGLKSRGVRAVIRPEARLIQRARYPRVFDPWIRVFRPQPDQPEPVGLAVQREVVLESAADGRTVARTAAGEQVGDGWRQAGTLATIGGDGFVDLPHEQFYEPGCKLFVQENGQVQVVRGQPVMLMATPENRQRWSRPWVRLSSYLGTDKLCPQLPEAYRVTQNLILLGDSTSGELVAALQASELLPQVADASYPGPGKALLSVADSPFALERYVILIGACDEAGVRAGARRLVTLARP